MPDLLEEQRENWGSRAAFVLAAVGSAVGLGNLWGFPYKLYSHGGGAFLIPYVIAMVLVGIPLLIAEFSLGHMTQRATPDAFGRANRKFAFVGWWQIILSFIIITYYAVILAWCMSFLYYSVVGIFQGGLPWAGKGVVGVQKANDFFFKDYLAFNDKLSLDGIQGKIVIALVLTWALMYLCIFRGVKLVSKVVLWTVPLPWLMLLILTVRGMTLPGAVQGLEFYLEPNWSNLADPATWRWAFGQMFFSMSLAFGVMITYASFLHRKSDINNNAAIIGLADVGTSFVAGLAVFATIGGMAYATAMAGKGVPVDQVAKEGPGLAFVAFPYALAQLPYAAYFSFLFFASLLLLGIDSAFSITECVLASIVDKTGWSRGKTLIGLSLIGLAIGLVYCTHGGLSWLGLMNDFINGTWGITLTALLECVVLGWLFRIDRLREHANERSDWKLGKWWNELIRVAIPILLGALFAWSFFDGMTNPAGYARTYAADPVTLTVPATKSLPDRPTLQVQFVSTFNDKAEHTLTLDETADAPPEGWTVGDASTALGEGFAADDLAGKPLTFTTAKAKPGTACTVQYRWVSRPRNDPKTGLAIKAESEPKWIDLAELTTTRQETGVNVGNTASLGVMALAPLLAIAISALRFRRGQSDELIDDHESGTANGTGSTSAMPILLSVAALGLIALGFCEMLGASADLRAGVSANRAIRTLVGVPLILFYIIGAAVTAVAAHLPSRAKMAICERQRTVPPTRVRLAAAVSVVEIGVGAGLAMAFVMLTTKITTTKPHYNAELSGISYILLGAMLGLIVVGLGWCFYRALRAAGGDTAAQQSEDMDS